jgi:hypothetical protein
MFRDKAGVRPLHERPSHRLRLSIRFHGFSRKHRNIIGEIVRSHMIRYNAGSPLNTHPPARS